MPTPTKTQIVERCFAAYANKDRAAIEALIADDLRFTSPYDDAIDRATYFERCWPNSERIVENEIEHLVEAGDDVFATYRCMTRDGKRFRNTERITVTDGQIHRVEVFFGAEYDEAGHVVTSKGNEEAAVRDVLARLARAVHDKDADGVVAAYTQDLVRYDLPPPLAFEGEKARDTKDLEAWFATWRGPIDITLKDLVIEIDGDLAACRGFIRIAGDKVGGDPSSVWARRTVCLRREEGAWKIFHEHTSVPFYMDGSVRAAVDLEP
jgi:ketosteroid isomerase-like protein